MRPARFARLWSLAAAVAVTGVITASCTTTETETVATTRSSPTVVKSTDRVVMSTNGRWELRGDGVAAPHYWVWIPAGATPVAVPPPPPLPR